MKPLIICSHPDRRKRPPQRRVGGAGPVLADDDPRDLVISIAPVHIWHGDSVVYIVDRGHVVPGSLPAFSTGDRLAVANRAAHLDAAVAPAAHDPAVAYEHRANGDIECAGAFDDSGDTDPLDLGVRVVAARTYKTVGIPAAAMKAESV